MHLRNSCTRSTSSWAIRQVPSASGFLRRERLDALLDLVVPRHVGDEVLDRGKCLHRLDGDRVVEVEIAHSRHAHELGHAVDLGRARAALAGLAVPAARQVRRLRRLNLVHGVEDDHALADLGGVVLELAALFVGTPDAETLLVP